MSANEHRDLCTATILDRWAWVIERCDLPSGHAGSHDCGAFVWNREGLCSRSEHCALVEEHGGCCDPRSEAERTAALHDLLDAGVAAEELTERMEAGARAAWSGVPS